MNIIFDPIVSEFDGSDHEAEYNAWFKAKVEASQADPRPTIPHDEVVARRLCCIKILKIELS